MCDAPDTTGLEPHERTLVLASWVKSVVDTEVTPTRRTPPRAAFRANRKGRRAWLDQAGRQLRREGLLLDRDLPSSTRGTFTTPDDQGGGGHHHETIDHR
jgi:hypothetical protein